MHVHKCTMAFHPKGHFQHTRVKQPSVAMPKLNPPPGGVHIRSCIAALPAARSAAGVQRARTQAPEAPGRRRCRRRRIRRVSADDGETRVQSPGLRSSRHWNGAYARFAKQGLGGNFWGSTRADSRFGRGEIPVYSREAPGTSRPRGFSPREFLLRETGEALVPFGSKRMRRTAWLPPSEKGEVLLRGVGALRYYFPPNASVQWQPGDLTIHSKRWFLGAGFLGATPISLTPSPPRPSGSRVPAEKHVARCAQGGTARFMHLADYRHCNCKHLFQQLIKCPEPCLKPTTLHGTNA